MENLVPLKTRQSKSELYNPQASRVHQTVQEPPQQQQQSTVGANIQNPEPDDWLYSEFTNYLIDNGCNTTQAAATIEDLDCLDQLLPLTTNAIQQGILHDRDLIQILEDSVEDVHSKILKEANDTSTIDMDTTTQPQPFPAKQQFPAGKRLPLPTSPPLQPPTARPQLPVGGQRIPQPTPPHVSEEDGSDAEEDDMGVDVGARVRVRSKRRRSISSSSTGSSSAASEASSHVSHSSKRSRASRASGHSRKSETRKRKLSDHHDKRSDSERRRRKHSLSSRERTPKPRSSMSSASRRASRDKTQMPPPPPGAATILTAGARNNTFADTVPPPPPPHMDSVFKDIQQKKARAFGATGLCGGRDSDAASSHCNTVKSTRVRKTASVIAASKGPMSVDDVLVAMDEEIRPTDIARATAEVALSMNVGSVGNRRREIVDCVKLIKRYDVCRDPVEGSIEINAKNYLFSAVKETFGINVEVVSANNVKSSLLHALSNMSRENTHEDRLDLVFRSSLKEIAKNLPEEGSPLISARYLELALIKNIRDFYKRKYSHDIVRFFTRASSNDQPKMLIDIATDSECEGYLRKLCDRYELTHSNFDQEFSEPLDVTTMRVWTSRESQIHSTNVHVLNHLNQVTEAVARVNEDVAERKGAGLKAFCEAYRDATKSVLSTHKKLITELLHTSELMAWMCFGLVIDDETYGFRNMAASHYNLYCKRPDFKEANKIICWNYPLASQYRFKKPKAFRIPEDNYLDVMEEAINNEP